MVGLFLLSILSIAYGQLTKNAYYTNWMKTMSTASTTFDTYRLIDIILPGSHHAGMYGDAIEANNYAQSSDDYYTNVINWASGGNEAKLKWSERQMGTVEDQLNAGSRFLDIRLEKSGATIYAHNGLLGATLTTMLADIKSFLDASDKKDIIILSFNNFINIPTPSTVFTSVVASLGSYMADSGYNIATDSISSLLNNNINVIALYDGVPGNAYILNSNDVLTGNETMSSESSLVISNILSQLVTAWDTTQASGDMNQIYYTLDITAVSELNKFSNLFVNYLEFNADLAVTLPNTIGKYSKLYFGNILIVDFIQASSVTDQVITLNYNYDSCRDPPANWNDAMDCSDLTDLGRDYKDSLISQSCTTTTSLQTSCKRSCGMCPWLSGVPGAACDDNTNACDSIVYTSTIGGDGECFIREPEWDSFINQASFCLAPFKNADCGSISSDTCDKGVNGEVAACTEFCDADFQCVSGYCNSKMGVCLEISTPAPIEATKSTECYCPHVVSDQAVDFRDDIEGFRPGDPDGKYEFVGASCSDPSGCNEVLDENPYIKSLVGFIVIPFIFAIIMFILYFCCCLCWCSCGNFWKKKCCRCCLGEPDESLGARWGPTVVMSAVLIVILWACIEGMTANQKMHDHVFSADEASLRTEMLGLFDTVIDKFEGIGPEADWIVDNVKGILGTVDTIVANVDTGTADDIAAIYGALNYIAATYNDYSLNATVNTPFTPVVTEKVNLPCDYCSGLGAQIGGINDTFKSAVSIVDQMSAMLNNTGGLTDAEDAIDTAVAKFNQVIDNLTSQVADYRNQSSVFFDDFEAYDEKREMAGTWFFVLPIFWIVLWVIGVLLAVFKKCNKLGECCFRFTWCPAMFIGATIMLIFSFFSILSVGWADFCVNLDEFEADPINSRLGQTISGVSGNSSVGGGFDPVTVVNACWTGSDLLSVMNMTDQLDWSSFRENLTDVLNIDITKEFTLDAMDSFITEINLLNTDEFEVEGDRLIAQLNAVGAPTGGGEGCVCVCGSVHGTEAALFTRAKLQSGQCYNATHNEPNACWMDPLTYGGGLPNGYADHLQLCIGNFTAAFAYVQAEIQLIASTEAAITDIKNETQKLIDAYNGIFSVAVNIERSVENISCSINPIFDRFDSIIQNYSNCGFLGAAYGGFKNVGCVLLFTDMYWISCAMMVIAFISVLVVCLGFMTQYSWHPATDDDDEDDISNIGSKLVKRASQKMVTTPLGRQMSARASAQWPGSRVSASLRDLQLSVDMANELENEDDDEMNEGGNESKPPPPSGPAPSGPAPGDENNTNDTVIVTTDQANETNDGNNTVNDTIIVTEQNENTGDLEMPQINAPSAPTDFEADQTGGGDVL